MIKNVYIKAPNVDAAQIITPPDVLAEYRRLTEYSRETLEFHMPYELEMQIMQAVRNGDPERLKNVYEDLYRQGGGAIGVMSGNELRQSQYTLISGVAFFSRLAVEGGLEQEVAYNLSDAYLHIADACTDPDKMMELFLTASLDFARRVKIAGLSGAPAIKTCKAYISKHLHYRITLEELAQACHLSQSYLSALFCKEEGISVKDYVLSEKLEAARNLLLTTELSVAEVASQFAFCTHSNFAAHFKKKYGTTPQRYRGMGKTLR